MASREHLLCFRLGVAMRRVSKIYAEALAPHGITPPQLFLLFRLQECDGQNPKQLAQSVCLDSSSITGLLDRTENAGFVQRQPDPADRRALQIFLTDEGRARLAALQPVLETLQTRIHQEFFADYSAEQVQLFLSMLDRVQTAAEC